MKKRDLPDVERLFGESDTRHAYAPDGQPSRFVSNWLTFNHARPVQRKKAWVFVAAIVALLAFSALFAVWSAIVR